MKESKKENKPIKRDPAIVRFSKDHHFGLLLVWKIREGLKKSVEPARISKYVISFFGNELVPHFRDEEINLFARLSQDNEMRVRAEDEHRLINSLTDELRKDNSRIDILINFADTLEKHIRFEERELFNFLQQKLDPSELAEIESAGKESKCNTDSGWSDKFWN